MSTSTTLPKHQAQSPEPRWPVTITLLAAGAAHFVLPRSLVMGPPWVVLSTVALLLGCAIYSRRHGHWRANEVLSYLGLCLLTLALIYGVAALLWALPRRVAQPAAL